MIDSPTRPLVAPTPVHRGGGRTHWAHVAVVALHTICCGLPLAASMVGLAASAALMGGVLRFHTFLHGRELWLLGISAALVLLGGLAEWRFMRDGQKRISRLFAVSLACFAFNAAIIAGHRLSNSPVAAIAMTVGAR